LVMLLTGAGHILAGSRQELNTKFVRTLRNVFFDLTRESLGWLVGAATRLGSLGLSHNRSDLLDVPFLVLCGRRPPHDLILISPVERTAVVRAKAGPRVEVQIAPAALGTLVQQLLGGGVLLTHRKYTSCQIRLSILKTHFTLEARLGL
jgi:hypothetical protein